MGSRRPQKEYENDDDNNNNSNNNKRRRNGGISGAGRPPAGMGAVHVTMWHHAGFRIDKSDGVARPGGNRDECTDALTCIPPADSFATYSDHPLLVSLRTYNHNKHQETYCYDSWSVVRVVKPPPEYLEALLDGLARRTASVILRDFSGTLNGEDVQRRAVSPRQQGRVYTTEKLAEKQSTERFSSSPTPVQDAGKVPNTYRISVKNFKCVQESSESQEERIKFLYDDENDGLPPSELAKTRQRVQEEFRSQETDFEQFVTFDDELAVCRKLTDAEIVTSEEAEESNINKRDFTIKDSKRQLKKDMITKWYTTWSSLVNREEIVTKKYNED
ncbi:hypothetical protein GWI33_016408 [Rhynchophorus ferrugineus]|uniref:Uncharacterized protein n=1 Tax=Rhynchophorus ferrugineus TaxID=354439 RepID=A0A834M3C2_RHYFE|nr:hypothetical protein GWI33_016408 [Rhynchophorus ferrugineus]